MSLCYILILHQTTTIRTHSLGLTSCVIFLFYIKPQLSNFSPEIDECCVIFLFYIKPQLVRDLAISMLGCVIFLFYIKPQRADIHDIVNACCVIFLFYIKPQPMTLEAVVYRVVLYFYSTSNHNWILNIQTRR